jgi:tRNA (guanine-N7-)-methyltransferase
MDMATDTPTGPRAFFGRRRGRPLRERQAALTETLLPRLAIDLAAPPPDDVRALFPVPVDAVRMEIGFGGGEHLMHEASAAPTTGFIGCEPFVAGMAKALAAIEAAGLGNVRLHADDATAVLEWLPAGSLSRVDLLYPDPWPKKRHWKRRFVSPAMLDRLARVLRPGAEFRFASDIDTYVDWTLAHGRDHPAFAWTAATADDWRRPWAGWPGTRYEAKAVAEGRRPAYLTFRRR